TMRRCSARWSWRSTPRRRRSATTGTPGAALVLLVESAYRGESSRAGWTTEADLLSGRRTNAGRVTAELEKPGSHMIVMTVDDEIVACCQVEHRGGHAYFGMFAVRPALQAGGFGRAVLAEAERFARDTWGVGEMRMTVISAREELLAWYVRRGYIRTGELIPFPYEDEEVGVPSRDDLEMELLVKKLG
ncbi:GNAT family N-acetyltransferase, partial [Streptosporangium sp. NPDC048865]|uniref:GNAT family N-acetyltransferase n=1 Tax=Streptosporangium sp. NPDC048865 TaxID=3155766 RepID=UPI003437883C